MAETVTISTFLELRDNMSAGLKKVEAALGAVSKANQTSQRAQATSAERAQKQQERAARAEEQRIRRLAKMQMDAAALDARLRARALQGARNDAVARMKENDRTAQHQIRAARKAAEAQARIERSRLGPVFDPASRSREILRQQQAVAKAAAAQARIREAAERRVARAAEVEARRASRAVAAGARASTAASAASSRARIAHERRVATEAARAAQDRKRFIGQAGAAMFGPGVGGIISAYVGGGMAAAGPLAALTALEAALGAVKKAAVVAYDAVKGFIIKTFEVGQRYQNDVRNIALTLRGLDVTPTFTLGKKSAQDLYETMRVLAAKLPGETQDYMSVFGFGLPTALDAGLKKSEAHLKDYAKFVSKFTAYGFVRGVTDPFHLGRDLERLQQGKVIGQTRMFKELKPFLDYAIRGTKEFNALAADVRMAHVFKAVEKATRGIDETLYDADALLGTMNSEITRIYQKGGQPLFASSLRIIERINKYLIDNNSKIVEMVSLISSRLGHVLEGAADKILGMANNFGEVVAKVEQVLSVMERVSPMFNAIGATIRAAISGARELEAIGARKELEREREKLRDVRQKTESTLGGAVVQKELGLLRRHLGKTAAVWDPIGMPKATAEVEAFALRQARESRVSGEEFEAMWRTSGMSQERIKELWQKGRDSIHGGYETMPTETSKRHRAPRDRQTTINDFRFSKFDIKQEFAEGFDPDRIAVAFASDLAKLGEMRMQSAYAPLFATRSSS